MESLESLLDRWLAAGLVDGPTAEGIRAFESERNPDRGLRWPAILAIAFGALMVGGGLMLFVAAHWETMSPSMRFFTVLAKVIALHLAGALLAERSPRLSTAFHGLGTLALGAGIFLAGQIFNLEEHWPGGVLLWALGAWIGFALLRDWVQGLLAALLTPCWLAGEWIVATDHWRSWAGEERVLTFGALLLAFTYLTARRGEEDGLLRRALMWVGGLALLPAVFATVASSWGHPLTLEAPGQEGLLALGWSVTLLGPLVLAWRLRGKAAWMNLVAAGWAWMLGIMPSSELPLYAWCALGAVGLVFWGLHESRRERVNLGVVGFALTLLFFYFSSVMDKLGRSFGLMGLGLLFLLGGWQLERLRRNLNARIAAGGAR
ncbi:MAG: DUF2157 domain-containing protein [Acidobacteria bacterium]|nr:DUF2157 domain-containing protein [Acidobacteriota bacterium]MBI3487919.1 DUF2157 domain-containing protein [Acidobacteriota bacterium]